MSIRKSGRCLCGAVSFTATLETTDYGACHCRMCQRWTGLALLGVNIKADAIDWQGTGNIRRLQSSIWAERAWCDGCGSPLWYRVTVAGPHKRDYEVPIGLFDDANDFRLTREIFIDVKPHAFALAGDHEKLTEAETIALYAPDASE